MKLYPLFVFALFAISLAQAATYSLVAPSNFTIYSTPQNISINSTITATALQNLTLNWSYANYSFYDSSLVLALDFDNIPALGENQSVIKDTSVYGNNGSWLGDSFNNGVLVGSPSWVTGKFGGGLQFNGSNYISTTIPRIANGTDATYSMWLYPTLTGVQFYLSDSTFFQYLFASNGGGLQININGVDCSAGSLSSNTWNHLTISIKNMNLTAYINGVVVKTSCFLTNSSVVPNLIGTRNNLVSNMNGSVDSVRVWGRALNATEVGWEMNSSRPVSGFGLVGDWEFEENLTGTVGALAWTAFNGGYRTAKTGVNITATASGSLALNKNAGSNCTTGYLLSSVGAVLASAAFSGNTASIAYPLVAGTSYSVVCDAGGSAYVWIRDASATSFPQAKTGFSYVGTFLEASVAEAFDSLTFFPLAQDTHNFVVGKYEGATNHNGSTYVNLSHLSSVQFETSPFTASVWFKTTDTLSGLPQTLLGSLSSGGWPGWACVLTSTKVQVQTCAASASSASITSNDGNWHYATCLRNSTGIFAFVDGVTAAGNTDAAQNASTTGNLQIGRYGDYGTPQFFKGSVDGVRVWNRSLSAGEVLQQYRSNLAKYAPNTWIFNTTQPITTLGRYPFQFATCDSTNCTGETRDLYYGGYTNITVFDETTSAPLNATITITNTTNTVTFTDTKRWLFFDETPIGLQTITATNSTSYAPRTVYNTATTLTQANLSLYLLGSGFGQYIVFNVRTSGGNPIVAATILVSKIINGSNTIIGMQLTDSTGSANFFLSPSTSYNVTVQAAGYTTQTVTITPSYSPITIVMGTGGANAVTGFWANVTYSLSPATGVLDYTNQVQKINFTVSDGSVNLTSFALSVYFNGSRIYYSNNTTSASGGSIIATMNNSYYYSVGGTYPQVFAFGQINKAGFSPVNVSASWVIANTTYSPYSLQGSLDYTAAQPGLYFIVFIIGIIAMVAIGRALGGAGPAAIIVMVLVMAVMMFAGFLRNATGIDWVAFVMFAGVGVLLALRSYQ